MLELFPGSGLPPGLQSGGEAAVLLSLWTTGHGVTEVPESGRNLPRHESWNILVERELSNSKSRLRFLPNERSAATFEEGAKGKGPHQDQ